MRDARGYNFGAEAEVDGKVQKKGELKEGYPAGVVGKELWEKLELVKSGGGTNGQKDSEFELVIEFGANFGRRS